MHRSVTLSPLSYQAAPIALSVCVVDFAVLTFVFVVYVFHLNQACRKGSIAAPPALCVFEKERVHDISVRDISVNMHRSLVNQK